MIQSCFTTSSTVSVGSIRARTVTPSFVVTLFVGIKATDFGRLLLKAGMVDRVVVGDSISMQRVFCPHDVSTVCKREEAKKIRKAWFSSYTTSSCELAARTDVQIVYEVHHIKERMGRVLTGYMGIATCSQRELSTVMQICEYEVD